MTSMAIELGSMDSGRAHGGNYMNIEIKRLTPDMAEDYVRFFDNCIFRREVNTVPAGC